MEYDAEGLGLEAAQPEYSQECIDLICGNDESIINLLNDTCSHPKQVSAVTLKYIMSCPQIFVF